MCVSFPGRSDAGTLWYRAPESLLGVKDTTTACDMWAAAAIYMETLTGARVRTRARTRALVCGGLVTRKSGLYLLCPSYRESSVVFSSWDHVRCLAPPPPGTPLFGGCSSEIGTLISIFQHKASANRCPNCTAPSRLLLRFAWSETIPRLCSSAPAPPSAHTHTTPTAHGLFRFVASYFTLYSSQGTPTDEIWPNVHKLPFWTANLPQWQKRSLVAEVGVSRGKPAVRNQ